jgi:hypothetical protein
MLRRGVAALTLVVSGWVLYPVLARRLAEVTNHVWQDLHSLLTSTVEERKIHKYGDRDNIGYGYLRAVLNGIPDPHLFPVTRYQDFTRNAHLLFPELVTHIDDRLLVGIDLKSGDLTENDMAVATPVVRSIQPGRTTMLWTFATENDYDLMTGVTLSFPPPLAASPLSIRMTLFPSRLSRSPLGSWTLDRIPPAYHLSYKLAPPLRRFSFSRGSTPFALELEILTQDGTSAVQASSVTIVGVKVDLSDYTIVHRDGRCLTAVKTTFLTGSESHGTRSWRTYFETLSNVGAE